MTRLSKFLRDNRGSTATEYGLIAALVVVAVISGISSVGTGTESVYEYVKTAILEAT